MVHTGLIFRQIDYFCTSHLTGVAQLVEHRSPKPSVGRSSRSSRASRIIAAFFVPDPKGLCSYVPKVSHVLFFWLLTALNTLKYPFLCNKNGMKAELFIPCFIDQLYPDTAVNVFRILKRAGVEVTYNPEQTCCGQPAFNSGFTQEASSLAYKFIDDFHGAKTIVTPSASCAAYIRQYYAGLLKEDPTRLQTFETLKPGIFELSDFLVNVLKVKSFDAEFPHRVTYHDSCSALRHYGIKEEPRILLREVQGLELIEMKDTEVCCGFGGTFSAKFKHISTAMTAKKVENAIGAGVRYIVSSEASCLMNMESYIRKQKLPIQTIHLADVIGCFRDQ